MKNLLLCATPWALINSNSKPKSPSSPYNPRTRFTGSLEGTVSPRAPVGAAAALAPLRRAHHTSCSSLYFLLIFARLFCCDLIPYRVV